MIEFFGFVALVCTVSYFLGAIPFGVLVSRMQGVDITSVGSGNIGATNVYRALGWKAALAVFLLDVAKGAVPALVVRSFEFPFALQGVAGFHADIALLAGIAAVVGHCASPFLGFRGGKGIATALGAALGSVPLIAICALGVFVLVMAFTRIVSLSSIIAALSTLLWGGVFGATPFQFALFAAIALFIVYRHRANIARLLKGQEPKLPLGGRLKGRNDEEGSAKDEDDVEPHQAASPTGGHLR